MWAPRTMAELGGRIAHSYPEAKLQSILCQPPKYHGPPNESFSAQSLNVHMGGGWRASSIPSRCTHE